MKEIKTDEENNNKKRSSLGNEEHYKWSCEISKVHFDMARTAGVMRIAKKKKKRNFDWAQFLKWIISENIELLRIVREEFIERLRALEKRALGSPKVHDAYAYVRMVSVKKLLWLWVSFREKRKKKKVTTTPKRIGSWQVMHSGV